jgi:hypothetical protein
MIACTAIAKPVFAVAVGDEMLVNGNFASGNTGWTTWLPSHTSIVPTVTFQNNSVKISKLDVANNADGSYTQGVVYQAVNVAAGAKVKLAGIFSGEGCLNDDNNVRKTQSWWASVELFSLPTSIDVTKLPSADGLQRGTTYAASYDYNYLEACFDYPGNYATFGANGGNYASLSNYVNPLGNTWSNQPFSNAVYNADAFRTAYTGAGKTWLDIERQDFNGTSEITSNGVVYVALKYGSRNAYCGDATFSNLSLTVTDVSGVPEPSSFALLIAGLIGAACYVWRKRK